MLASTGATSLAAATAGRAASHGVPSHRLGTAVAAQAPLVAVSLRGDIYVVPADGSAPPRRLTAYGHNGSPALSPHGRLIAYLSVPRGGLDKYGHASSHNVWIVPMNGASDGSSGYKITPTNLNADRGELAWAPNGQHLAYVEVAKHVASVVVVDYQGNHSIVVWHAGFSFANARVDTLAWTPDSHRVAFIPPQLRSGNTTTISVAIASADGRAGSVITVRFPSDMFSGRQPGGRGSSSDLNGLAWAPDGRHLVMQTSGAGEGLRLTGLWQVADSGGVARLFVGTPAGVRQGGYSTGAYAFMSDAVRFALSPDGRYVLIDRSLQGREPGQQSGFWLANADGTQGRLLNPASLVSLVCCTRTLAQSVWLTDSSGLAFVSLQVINGTSGTPSSGPPIRAQLYGIGLNGVSHLLYQLTDPDQGAMDIAPAFGCVECGA